MGEIEQRLARLGLQLPPPPEPPPGFRFSFSWVRLSGNRAFLSGHGALAADGTPTGPFGKVPSEVPIEQAQESARGAAVAMLGSLKRALGDLDRITAWLMAYGMVNADPGYPETTNVANGFSDLILELYGEDAGHHARMAVGMATLRSTTASSLAQRWKSLRSRSDIGYAHNHNSTWRWLAALVLVHLEVSFVHGMARGDANVPLTLAASLFVVIVVVLALR